MIDKDAIRQARQTDLAAYLLRIGEPLTRSGSRYKHKIHDSLVFTKNAYYWNSKGESGNAVDYLIRHMCMDFETAITALISFIPSEREIAGQAKKDLVTASDYRRAFAYLQKTRGIDSKLIQDLITSEHLKQEADTNNAVFVMYDEHGERVGAELEGTLSERRFKGVEGGSKYGYGFNLRYPIGVHSYRYALFFESAVDLLSFVHLKTLLHKKSLENCILVSMAGLKINILEHMTATFGGLPVLCIDNDATADEFVALVTAKGIQHRISRPNQPYKDWNEQLNSHNPSLF